MDSILSLSTQELTRLEEFISGRVLALDVNDPQFMIMCNFMETVLHEIVSRTGCLDTGLGDI